MKYTCPALIFALFRLSIELINKPEDSGFIDTEEVKSSTGLDEDELPMKILKVDQIRIFKCIAELIGLIK